MTGAPPAAKADGAGPLVLRRLTRREYNNTVRDLLGDDTRPADQFPSDADDAFLFKRAGLVSTQDASVLQTTAETLAAAAIKNLDRLLPCNPAGNETACARRFVEEFGLRAFRRPVLPDEAERLMALYTAGRGKLQLGFPEAIGLVLEGMLQSTGFLYHWERTPGPVVREGGLIRLGPYEMASRLSYFLLGTMPDRELFAAAAANELSSVAEVEAAARRLVKDARVKETFWAFFQDWLSLDRLSERQKDPKLYPEFNEALAAAMTAETRTFVETVLFDGDGKLGTLLTSSSSFVNQALGKLYGAREMRGTALERTELEPTQRRGLFTQASFLSVTGAPDGSSPIERGVKIYERVLCRTLPPPPADVPPARAASTGGTTRERFAEHGRQECGRACHDLFDGIGFAFEHYDGIGRYRTTDNGGAVDASGTVLLDGGKRSFANAVELVGQLAGSKDVGACFSTKWMRFALSRDEEDQDGASVEQTRAALERAGGDVRELMVAIATSRSFRYRSPAEGEVQP